MILLLVIACVIALEEGLNFFYKRTNACLNEKRETDKYKNVPENIEICNLGSSHARYAMTYAYSEYTGFNFALPPQNLSYDYSILRMYHKNMCKGCVVAIFLPICVFFLDRYQHTQSNYKYYYFLEKEYIEGYHWVIKELFLKRPLVIMPWKVRYIFKDVPPAIANSDSSNNNVIDRQNEAQKRILGWDEEFGLLKYADTQVPPQFVATTKILKDMIDYCIKREFTPVLVIPPVSTTMHEEIKKYNLNLNWMLYDQLTKEILDKAPLFDYFSMTEFRDDSYYLNADFLNEKGRRKFSEKFLGDIADKLCRD